MKQINRPLTVQGLGEVWFSWVRDMCVSLRLGQRGSAKGFHAKSWLALVVASALAGCSADVSRFDLGSTSFSETSSTSQPSSYNAGFATSSRDQGSGYGTPYGGGSNVSRSELAPPSQPGTLTTAAIDQRQQPNTYQTQGYPAEQYAPKDSPVSAGAAVPRGGKSAAVATERGDAIEVKPGDTLYKISRDHQVSVADLMSVNDLKSPAIKPGQKLYLPSQKLASAKSKASIKLPKTETAAAPALPSTAPQDWTGTYTVKQGDSLYQVARDHKVKLAELQSNNGIADARKVKPGTVLKVPGSSSASEPAALPAPTSPAASAPATAQVQSGSGVVPPAVPQAPSSSSAQATPSPSTTPAATSQSVAPTILNSAPSASGEQKVAAVETPNVASDAQPSGGASASQPGSGSVAAKLRWPVSGKVVSQFGPKSDGTHNDGINIAVPMGTDVKAAEGGVVAYAGDELKGYGNLVLIRHDNGWVTAYAHNDTLLVKRGETVKRGQVIAKTGKTGQVDQPQLHFELRQGQKPIDPTPHMEKM